MLAVKYPFPAWLALAFLVLVHLTAGKFRFLDVIPRSRWLSIGGGISVAYAFVRLLPEPSEHQEVLRQASDDALAPLEHHAYLVALCGLVTFYGLEQAAKQSRRRQRETGSGDVAIPAVFWVSIAAFAVYNALIGYLLLQRPQAGSGDLVFFTLAMALHFVVNDYGLHQHYKHLYTGFGRWVIASAVAVGALTGAAVAIAPPTIAMLVAFLTGGIILNMLKEELPEERESRFAAFALGAGGYAALLLSF